MVMKTHTPLASFPGIVIKNDSAKNPAFAHIAGAALRKIASTGTGHRMLSDIQAANFPATYGYKVAIMKLTAEIKARKHKNSSYTDACNTKAMFGEDDNASGSASVVFWDNEMQRTPDGARPPFIGLAHELIHCWHNTQGSADRDSMQDEFNTVGLAGYYTISENQIRAEHNLPSRATYSGQKP